MTCSNYRKALKQLKSKPKKVDKYIKHNAPKKRSCGVAKRRCRFSGRIGGRISKYGLNMSRQAFREVAPKLGFKKLN
ncbi:MAG: 30S ribosomal protein S14 [Candidatus Woesearchaeota archaeon]